MKRILIVLVLAALLTCGMALTVSAEEAVCPHCGKAISAIQWQPWTAPDNEPVTGHYYLEGTYVAQTERYMVAAGEDVCLDLRGNSYITEGIHPFRIYGSLSLMDSGEGGLFLTTGVQGTSGGFAKVEATGELNLYGGKVQRIVREDVSIYTGGLVYINGGKMLVDGGCLSGGVAKADGSINAQGGNIYMKGGSLELRSGSILGGMARATGTLKAQGGNIFASNGATITISGGTLSGGYSDQDGGNLFFAKADVVISGGKVEKGHSIRHGGNIAQTITDANNSLTISGGTVTGGVAGGLTKQIDSNGAIARGSGGGGNYYSYSAMGTLNITGGTVDGDLKIDKLENLTLSGSPKIGLGKANGLFIPQTVVADVSGLTDGAEIYVYAIHTFTKNVADPTAALSYFKGAVRTQLSIDGSALKATQGSQGYCPHCGQLVTWKVAIKASSDGEHCYITGTNSTSTEHLSIANTTVLDLNGYTVRRDGRRILMNTANKSLTVLDSFGGGKLEGSGAGNANGGLVYMAANTQFTLMSGSVQFVETTAYTANLAKYGGLICASGAGSTVTVNGGVITGGKLAEEGFGGNISIGNKEGVFTMTAGILQGGNAAGSPGGNLYCNGIADISGGVILGGSAKTGGNIYGTASSKLTLSGGLILNGQTETGGTGGNICHEGTAEDSLKIQGGTVLGGKALKGGNVAATGFVISGGDLIGGFTEGSGQGGNLYVMNTSLTRDITGGTLAGGLAPLGGNIYITGASATVGKLTISGGLVTGGRASSTGGGNLYLPSYTQVEVAGTARVLGGTHTSGGSGGSIYITGSGHLKVSGGVISGGKATKMGGNIYMSSATSKLTVTGGVIEKGISSTSGGNIHLNSGILNMTGGTIRQGRSTKGGNLCMSFYAGSTAVIDGAQARVLDGTATAGYGGNILFLDEAHQPNSQYSPHATAPWFALGQCEISGGTSTNGGDDIYINQNAWFRMLESFSGDITVCFHKSQLPTPLYGGMLNETSISSAGSYTGTLRLENSEDQPRIFAKDGKLQVAASAIMKDGESIWYEDNGKAVAAYQDGDILRAGPGALELTGGSYLVDLAGQDLAITGTGSLRCFDSSNHTYETFGSATIVGPVLEDTQVTVGNRQYFALEEEGTYSFHCLQLQLTNISLRPGNAGIYYTAKWNCDPTLAAKITRYGVVVSLKAMPGADFAQQGDCLYTEFTDLQNGNAKNSVLVTNILNAQAGSDNAERAKMPIYANTYVTVDGKECVGLGASQSLSGMLTYLQTYAYEYYEDSAALDAFVAYWNDYGAALDFDYTIPEEIRKLKEVYAGTQAYQGELHDHADTGGTSDGHYTLSQWVEGMDELDMDFATIVDHKQALHYDLPEWDKTRFIFGSEASSAVSGLNAATKNRFHYNLIFKTGDELVEFIEKFPEFAAYTDETTGEWHFKYGYGDGDFTRAGMEELVQTIKDMGGFFVHVHPKSPSYIVSTDPLDYWFGDWTGLEVFYTYKSDRNGSKTAANYELWTDLLALGKKVWATAGNDEHAAPSDKAVSTIYATEQHADKFVDQLRTGNFVAGGVGIQMTLGGTPMGSQCDFTGKQLAFRVADFHRSVYKAGSTYRVELISDQGVEQTFEISPDEIFYFAMDADASRKFYRVEVFDETGSRIAIGNPIWNLD